MPLDTRLRKCTSTSVNKYSCCMKRIHQTFLFHSTFSTSDHIIYLESFAPSQNNTFLFQYQYARKDLSSLSFLAKWCLILMLGKTVPLILLFVHLCRLVNEVVSILLCLSYPLNHSYKTQIPYHCHLYSFIRNSFL